MIAFVQENEFPALNLFPYNKGVFPDVWKLFRVQNLYVDSRRPLKDFQKSRDAMLEILLTRKFKTLATEYIV